MDTDHPIPMRPSHPSSGGLYRRILGERFGTLPLALQRFHDQGTVRAHGVFEITRGRGLFRNVLATLMRLPPAGRNVSLDLQVTLEGERERWSRNFGGFKMVSTQWGGDGILMEASGPVRFAFEVTVVDQAMRFAVRRAWFLGVQLPGWLTPRVTALAAACDGGWAVDVRIPAPFVGLLVRYAGTIKFDPASPEQSMPLNTERSTA